MLRDLFVLFRHFVNFPIDDSTGTPYTLEKSYEEHNRKLARLQRASFKHFQEKLALLALSNYGSIERRSDLQSHLSNLTNDELCALCVALGFRTKFPRSSRVDIGRELLLEILISTHERRKTFQEVIRDLTVLPTEVTFLQA